MERKTMKLKLAGIKLKPPQETFTYVTDRRIDKSLINELKCTYLT